MQMVPKHQQNFRMKKFLCSNASVLTSLPMANPLAKMKLHKLMGWIYLSGQPLVIALSETINLMITLTYSYMSPESYNTHPIKFLISSPCWFQENIVLISWVTASKVVFTQRYQTNPNLNDISSQDRHLFEPTSSYHALTHDNNPSVVASSPTIVTNYGK